MRMTFMLSFAAAALVAATMILTSTRANALQDIDTVNVVVVDGCEPDPNFLIENSSPGSVTVQVTVGEKDPEDVAIAASSQYRYMLPAAEDEDYTADVSLDGISIATATVAADCEQEPVTSTTATTTTSEATAAAPDELPETGLTLRAADTVLAALALFTAGALFIVLSGPGRNTKIAFATRRYRRP